MIDKIKIPDFKPSDKKAKAMSETIEAKDGK